MNYVVITDNVRLRGMKSSLNKKYQLDGQSKKKKKNVSWSNTIVTSVKVLPNAVNSAVSNNNRATHKINNKRRSSSSSSSTTTTQCSIKKKGEEKWVPKYSYDSDDEPLDDNENGRYSKNSSVNSMRQKSHNINSNSNNNNNNNNNTSKKKQQMTVKEKYASSSEDEEEAFEIMRVSAIYLLHNLNV